MARKQIKAWVPKRNKVRLGSGSHLAENRQMGARSPSRRMLFIWLMLAGFIFLFSPQNLTNKLQFAFARIFHWPLSIGRSISLSAQLQQPHTDVVSRRKYNQLQNHLANIIAQRDQAYQEIKKISGLRKRLPLEDAKIVIAYIITASIDATRSEFIINRGKNYDLAIGQFVLGDNSIIGTIFEVDVFQAKVRLFTDPRSKIAVKIAGLNIERIMQGNGNDSARIQLVRTNRKIKIGDKVQACKKPGFLDVPMIMGTVTQCEKDDENPLLWDITVKPACNIEELKDVAVIIMNSQ